MVAADTVVVVGSAILGKPSSQSHARKMLARLSGREHRVMTGVAVSSDGGLVVAVDVTRVRFRSMSAREILDYVGTGEPMDKAGAYHVDGGGACFIESISGSPSNVAGLSVTTLRRLLEKTTPKRESAKGPRRVGLP